MTWFRSEEGWSWHDSPNVVLSSGPARVDTSTPAPDHEPRPVGFTANLGTTKPVTDSDDIDAVLARVPDHLATLARRCDECGDVEPHHFRCCSRHPKDDR